MKDFCFDSCLFCLVVREPVVEIGDNVNADPGIIGLVNFMLRMFLLSKYCKVFVFENGINIPMKITHWHVSSFLGRGAPPRARAREQARMRSWKYLLKATLIEVCCKRLTGKGLSSKCLSCNRKYVFYSINKLRKRSKDFTFIVQQRMCE